jgi:hypothetical protein
MMSGAVKSCFPPGMPTTNQFLLHTFAVICVFMQTYDVHYAKANDVSPSREAS